MCLFINVYVTALKRMSLPALLTSVVGQQHDGVVTTVEKKLHMLVRYDLKDDC